MKRQVADLVEAAKNLWVEQKVEETENKYDPRGAWKAMKEVSSMFVGHIHQIVGYDENEEEGWDIDHH